MIGGKDHERNRAWKPSASCRYRALNMGPLERALASLCTSALLLALGRRLLPLDMTTLQVCFGALLPTLLALNYAIERRGLRLLAKTLKWKGDLDGDGADSNAAAVVLAAARTELMNSCGGDSWASRPAQTAAALALGAGPSLANKRRPHRTSMLPSSSNALLATNGKSSLYDQVKQQLRDHVFPRSDGPIYLMDPTTGKFLKATEHHRVTLTSTPDASCLFHVAKGKTHHWGFQSTLYQRFLGQNFVGKVIVSSKKLAGWEAFRVVERPDEDDTPPGETKKPNQRSNTIYLILCSARFGKGMWLAKDRRSTSDRLHGAGSSERMRSGSNHSNPDRNSLNGRSSLNGRNSLNGSSHRLPLASRTNSNSSNSSSNGEDRGGLYLSKNFASALALHYASDLSAFEYLTKAERVPETPAASGPASVASDKQDILQKELPTALDTRFQPPVLASRVRTQVQLPWIDNEAATSASFLQLRDDQMTTVIDTTIANCMIDDVLDLLVSQETRKKVKMQAESGGSASAQNMSEWHAHPRFGLLRKLCYRPSPVTDSSEGPDANSNMSWKSVAIDEYHSGVLEDSASGLVKSATLRGKIYTLSIPYSNCFSVETLIELKEVERDTATDSLQVSPSVPELQFVCKAGVHFTRPTMFESQIQAGALKGVTRTCEIMLSVVKQKQAQRVAVKEAAGSTNLSPIIPAPVFDPYTIAIELLSGLIRSISKAPIDEDRISSLPVILPWKTYSPTVSELNGDDAFRPTAAPFFESGPHEFATALEESLGTRISPSMFFDVLLSDERSFFYAGNRQSGNMDIDISAWRPMKSSLSPSSGAPVTLPAYVRKQMFRMPLSGNAGVDVGRVETFQYYSLSESKTNLEFGMKIFAHNLPNGDNYSVRLLALLTFLNCVAEYLSCILDRSFGSCGRECNSN